MANGTADAGANTGPASPAPTPAERRRSASRDPKVFVLLRELSEVHLLLDDVSADPTTTVSELVNDEKLAKQGLSKNWIEKVCEISWPPDGSDDEKADDAALLIRAKDYLNRLSHPASGATIAFTHLVTQDPARRPGWRKRLANRLRLGRDGEAATETAVEGGRPRRGAATRRSLAETAYPDLVAKAESFRKAMWWISIGLVLTLVVTCGLSWYVAYGNAALSDFTAARQAMIDAQATVNAAEIAQAAPRTPEAGAGGGGGGGAGAGGGGGSTQAGAGSAAVTPAVTQAASPAALAEPFFRYCERKPYRGPQQAQACDALEEARDNFLRSRQSLVQWMCLSLFSNCEAREADPRRNQDAPSRAAALANIMGSAVLPFLYGLLGAGAAIIRSLSRKIRESLLSPRDLHLSIQQLALGAVVGACIGLFVAAPGSGEEGESLLGPVALSASAVSFVAGFGVDAVFQALESLIGRIFNLRQGATDSRDEVLMR